MLKEISRDLWKYAKGLDVVITGEICLTKN